MRLGADGKGVVVTAGEFDELLGVFGGGVEALRVIVRCRKNLYTETE